MVNLVSQVLSEPCYDCLRTKEQLGYIVFSGVRKVNGANGIRIIVQSAKHPSFVEDRIENFLQTYLVSKSKYDSYDLFIKSFHSLASY